MVFKANNGLKLMLRRELICGHARNLVHLCSRGVPSSAL